MKKVLFLMFFTLIFLSITAVSAEDSGILINDNNSIGQAYEVLSGEEMLSVDSTDDSNSGDSVGGDGTDSTDDSNSGDSVGGDGTDSTGDGSGDSNDDGNEVLDEKANSTLTASDVNGYESFTTTISIILTANGTALSSKPIQILLNGIIYDKITDANGVVKLDVKLTKGVYLAEILYDGDDLTTNASKTCKVTIESPIKTKLKIGDKYINYRQGSKCLFYVKLLDANDNVIKNRKVTFKVAGKTYTAITNKYGNAKIYLNLKKGTYTVKYYYYKSNAPYLASNGYFKIKVKPKIAKGNGYWLWSSDMKKVNLKTLAKKGTKHIFLHVKAISAHGKSAVISFIKKAHKNGIKVHLWMQVCYKGGKWVRPIDANNKIKYSFLNKKIKEAKKYAKIKGVDGIHFDYVRFGGKAYKYENPNRAMNYFMKKASNEIHKIKPNCIVSAAIMPEPSKMTEYYGQDVSTISKYSDVLLPMVYKGNYKKDRPWITSVTKAFVKQSNGAQVWTGLQAYKSDSNPKKLSHSTLLKDAKAAMEGGAKGVVLFRIGVSRYLNFKKV